MTILLRDICDISIKSLHDKLMQLKQQELISVIFMDNMYSLHITAKKATLTRSATNDVVYKVEYNLEKDFMIGFASISQMVCRLAGDAYVAF